MVRREAVILLACGTFNPPHPMHFRMFGNKDRAYLFKLINKHMRKHFFSIHFHVVRLELARDYLHQSKRYEVIGGIISPTHDTYAKNNVRLENGTHRCKMIELSLQSSDWIRLSQWETSQLEWTSTLNVLEYHQVFQYQNFEKNVLSCF